MADYVIQATLLEETTCDHCGITLLDGAQCFLHEAVFCGTEELCLDCADRLHIKGEPDGKED